MMLWRRAGDRKAEGAGTTRLRLLLGFLSLLFAAAACNRQPAPDYGNEDAELDAQVTPIQTMADPGLQLSDVHRGMFSGQDMAVVGKKLWIFGRSSSDHEVAEGAVYDVRTMERLGSFTQNISHAATVDYNPLSDTIMIGNAGDKVSEAPRIDLFPHFHRYGAGKFLDWNDQAHSPRISIDLIARRPSGMVVRSVFPESERRVANAVWGDDARTVYVFEGKSSIALMVVKLRLGIGSDDMSKGASGLGTFRSSASATEYNGTAQVVQTFTSTLFGITQGAAWHGDNLYLGWTAATPTDRGLQVLQLALVPNGTVRVVAQHDYLPLGSDKLPLNFETEAVSFFGDQLLVGGRRTKDDYGSVYRFTGEDTAVDISPTM